MSTIRSHIKSTVSCDVLIPGEVPRSLKPRDCKHCTYMMVPYRLTWAVASEKAWVSVIQKGWARVAASILLLIWHRLYQKKKKKKSKIPPPKKNLKSQCHTKRRTHLVWLVWHRLRLLRTFLRDTIHMMVPYRPTPGSTTLRSGKIIRSLRAFNLAFKTSPQITSCVSHLPTKMPLCILMK